ncbi:hypothetical protein AB0945_03050 [Streptomyces sp. NPDC005474]|uniref:hypothetical protein n=1 Tax=Streptomyces sp. NPDC005474 TaxID=3154878 RepID=UPI0034519F4B
MSAVALSTGSGGAANAAATTPPTVFSRYANADPDLPVLLLAHQPKFIDRAAAAGIDLQPRGHTHSGQIWPFHHLVRIDQPALAGLTHHSPRTLCGTGFWGPPFRILAPARSPCSYPLPTAVPLAVTPG